MSIIVLIEASEGKIKKSSKEAVSYAAALGDNVTAVCLENIEHAELAGIGKHGAGSVKVATAEINTVEEAATAIAEQFTGAGASTLVLAKSALSNSIAARLSVKLDASSAANVVALPEGSKVKTSIFTGNAFADVELVKSNRILIVNKNIVDIKEDGTDASVEEFSPSFSDSDSKVKVTNRDKASGQVLLPEADIVVSAGRGLKGPENWGIIEELAGSLGAATGCSKPVSDMDWRPHSEHVGQTGIKVSPSLYIAIGISGAIQHLAGVNSSKYIVVINTDEEAPFFKAADFGIVGDAFDIVPKLTEAVKAQQ